MSWSLAWMALPSHHIRRSQTVSSSVQERLFSTASVCSVTLQRRTSSGALCSGALGFQALRVTYFADTIDVKTHWRVWSLFAETHRSKCYLKLQNVLSELVIRKWVLQKGKNPMWFVTVQTPKEPPSFNMDELKNWILVGNLNKPLEIATVRSLTVSPKTSFTSSSCSIRAQGLSRLILTQERKTIKLTCTVYGLPFYLLIELFILHSQFLFSFGDTIFLSFCVIVRWICIPFFTL